MNGLLPGPRRTTALVVATIAAVGCADRGNDGVTAPARLSRAPRAIERPTDQSAAQPAGVLLACPTRTEVRATAWIGPEGGSVDARGVTLAVPAGAVAASTLFEVVVPVSQTLTVDIHAVGVESFQFLTPATITVSFARCSFTTAPVDQLQGANVDMATGDILAYMGGVVDESGRKLSFTTPHLSGYAIAY